MRVEHYDGGVRVVLSERNLRALISKLSMPDSACTIETDGVFISAEPDEQHYGARVPGVMHPLTEQAIRDWNQSNPAFAVSSRSLEQQNASK